MELGLENKRVLVCGASRGIGRAIAHAFLKEGAHVTFFARDAKKIQEAIAEAKCSGDAADYLVADFSNPSEVESSLAAYLKKNDGFDILVNNTGGPLPGKASEANVTDFFAAFKQHLGSNQVLVQGVIPRMKERQFGRIINIISTSVKQPIENLGVSNTVRGAVANWAKTLANELGSFGITVNNLLPGATETARLSEIFERKAIAQAKSAKEVAQHEAQQIPLRRFAKPEEIADAVVFLGSERASYITGTNLTVDGGRTGSL